MAAMLASSWRAPAAGSRLLSLSICASVSSMASAAVFSSTRATRRVPGIGAMSSPRGEDPRERGLGGGCADLCADRADLVDEGEVAAEVLPGKAGAGLAPVVVCEVTDGSDLSGDKAVAERRIGDEADPELSQQRQDVRLDVSGPQR